MEARLARGPRCCPRWCPACAPFMALPAACIIIVASVGAARHAGILPVNRCVALVHELSHFRRHEVRRHEVRDDMHQLWLSPETRRALVARLRSNTSQSLPPLRLGNIALRQLQLFLRKTCATASEQQALSLVASVKQALNETAPPARVNAHSSSAGQRRNNAS